MMWDGCLDKKTFKKKKFWRIETFLVLQKPSTKVNLEVTKSTYFSRKKTVLQEKSLFCNQSEPFPIRYLEDDW